jgi:HEAT repeat protein
VRLRSYVVVTLGDVGVPPAALPPLLEILANVDERLSPVEVGAAIRAAGSLGERGEPFVPYLTEVLALDRLNATEFSLERYEPLYPEEEATTVRLEAVRALGSICSAGDADALDALGTLANDADPRVVTEAGRAVQLIRSRRIR